MLQEYALEPALLSTWQRYQFLVSQFGFEQGRLISRYPKRWKKLVHESLHGCTEIEKLRITESLRTIDDLLCVRGGEWNNSLDWLNNAEREHTRKSFHAIVASDNPRDHDRVIDVDESDPTDIESLWSATTTVRVQRTAKGIADALDPVLANARKVVLVDPHFGPENRRHRVVLEEIARRISTHAGDRGWPSIHYVAGPTSTTDFFKSECESKLPQTLPLNCRVSLVAADRAQLHNRYVLTDRGGVQLGDGLDECEAGQQREDTFNLLGKKVAAELLDQYLSTERLTVRLTIVINGTC